jgi:hypothetical protein
MGAIKKLVVPALFILQTYAFPALAPDKALDLSKRAFPFSAMAGLEIRSFKFQTASETPVPWPKQPRML